MGFGDRADFPKMDIVSEPVCGNRRPVVDSRISPNVIFCGCCIASIDRHRQRDWVLFCKPNAGEINPFRQRMV
jgi:hypothetical protein